MAKISLRAYNHEIEEMIEHNQFDQATAHCRYILKFFPKHINTYRLLGKAFLESQRYGDAGDIFQRILSSFPEDFISHVGMSIIREDEGNLDDALWHMERAFELQPSNNALQGELRRLHGKLDGTEPSKIRLTRGALAHMYIRGDLFPQAIAELRIALTEDPSRFDLQTILAKAYHLSGQLAEAAKISNEIIGKLPYCFEANRILSDIYNKSDRSEEAQPYLQRLCELDPYYAQVNNNTPTPEQVNDAAITLDRLDWKPGLTGSETSTQPEWAKSIGVSMESQIPQEENMPDWLTPTETEKKPVQEISPIIEIPEEEGQTPIDWLSQEAEKEQAKEEWEMPAEPEQPGEETQSKIEEFEQPVSEIFTEEVSELGSETEAPAEELAPADIPEWLKSLAPDQSKVNLETPIEITSTPTEVQKEQEFSWLEETPTDEGETWPEPKEEKEQEPFSSTSEEKFEGPVWIEEADTEKGIPESEPQETFQAADQFTFESGEDITPEKSEFEEKKEFAWLTEENPEQISDSTLQKESSVWADETEEEPLPSLEAEDELAPAVEVELPEWLSQMKREAEEKGEVAQPAQDIPDWIKNIEEPPITEEDTKPTRLSKQPVIQEPTSFEREQFPEAGIFGATEIKDLEEETPTSTIFEEESFELPEETQEMSESTFTKGGEAEAQFGWLSEIEVQKQHEEEIFEKETPETPPEWIKETLQESEASETIQEEPGPLEEVQLPDWLAEVAPKSTEEIEPVADTKPDWLSEYAAEQPSIEEFTGETPSGETIFTLPETPVEEEKLEQVDAFTLGEFEEPEISAEVAPPKEESLPEWLLEYKEEETKAEEVTAPVSEEQPVSEVPAWFEQPEEESGLKITFEEEPTTVEEQLPTEEVQPAVFEVESTLEEELKEGIFVEEESLEEAPVSEAAFEEIPEVEKLFEETPVEEAPVGETFTSETIVEEIPEGEKPLEEVPVVEMPVEEVYVSQIVVEETPVEETQIEEVPIAEIPPEETLVSEIPIEEIPVEELPAEEVLVAETSPEAASNAETTISETPAKAPVPLLDLNKASLVELERIPGVGFIKAQNIINFRVDRGEFTSLEELLEVPGFDEALVQEIKPRFEAIALPQEPVHFAVETEIQNPLDKARDDLKQGNISEALNQYSQLINANTNLDDISFDLQDAVDQYPMETDIWQTLGDTCVRLGKLQDALNAYTEAERLLR